MSNKQTPPNVSICVPDVVMRFKGEPSAPRCASRIRNVVLEHFDQFANSTVDLLLSYHRLHEANSTNDPSTLRQHVMKRAEIVKYPEYCSTTRHYSLDMRCYRWNLEKGWTLRKYPSGLNESCAGSLSPVKWRSHILKALPTNKGTFTSGHKSPVPRLSGKREVLRWLRANADIWSCVISMSTHMEIGYWPAAIQRRFIQDAAFAAEASTLYRISQEETVLKAPFTPPVVRAYVLGRFPEIFASVPKSELASVGSFGWWRIEQDTNFDKCKAVARNILDTYYGNELLQSTLVAPIWIREPDVLSVELYLLYATENIKFNSSTDLIPGAMSHGSPGTQSACDSTEEVGRKARNRLNSVEWLGAFRAVIRNPGKNLEMQPRSWIRCICGAIGAFYVLYHDMDYDSVPIELHEELQTVLDEAWRVVPERFPDIKYVLTYPPLIPRRIREQCRDLYGNTSVDSHRALLGHIMRLMNTVDPSSEQFTTKHTSSSQPHIGGGCSNHIALHSGPTRTPQETDNMDGFHTTHSVQRLHEQLAQRDADGASITGDKTLELQVSALAHAADRISYTAENSVMPSLPHDHDNPPVLDGLDYAENSESLSLPHNHDNPPDLDAPHTNDGAHKKTALHHTDHPDRGSSPSRTTSSALTNLMSVTLSEQPTHLAQASPSASSQVTSKQASPSLGSGLPKGVLSATIGHLTERSADARTEPAVDTSRDKEPPQKKARLGTKKQPRRRSHSAKGTVSVVAGKTLVVTPAPAAARRTRLDVRSDPRRAILDWYYSGNRFDVPIWISYRIVRLKTAMLYYKNSMGDIVGYQFDPVLVPPEEVTAEMIRKWGWVVTAWPNECSMTTRGLSCCRCLEDMKDIPRLTFFKPFGIWVEGRRPTVDVMWDRLCRIQRWVVKRPLTKSEKQIRDKREASHTVA
ncbi:hypothetical protein CALCODRAFT_505405 [Calocera cornea HHB12733]|uniref:Uncharacterized protein n=1 Tax=Calocera cornea HHB12733 TaxID=1353952 RepID=A0A165K3K3_9BASI|nr:hypothetical protein CALCODRAFT_505405 [Calocera cornea HHB12733]